MMNDTDKKLSVLSAIAGCFNEKKITWALGGSALLYFHGIVDAFNDLDIMVEERDATDAKEILITMGIQHLSVQEERYGTTHFYEFLVDGVEVDVMGGFKIMKDGILHDCSLKTSEIVGEMTLNGQRIPLQSVLSWRRYYELMGRTAKAALIPTDGVV